MNKRRNTNGFSLTEVLMAVVIMAVGMIFVAGVFPVGIHFTTIAIERTTAAIAADEAFAKIRLYGVDFSSFSSSAWTTNPPTVCVDFDDVSSVQLNPDEFAYPSTNTGIAQKKYRWSAVCRRIGNSRDVQVTVFISRRMGAGTIYWDRINGALGPSSVYPVPVSIEVSQTVNNDELSIVLSDEATLINDGYTIVDDKTGRIYRVLERYADEPSKILLDSDWLGSGGGSLDFVWVVPPPVGGGRYPCIAVYQKVIRF